MFFFVDSLKQVFAVASSGFNSVGSEAFEDGKHSRKSKWIIRVCVHTNIKFHHSKLENKFFSFLSVVLWKKFIRVHREV